MTRPITSKRIRSTTLRVTFFYSFARIGAVIGREVEDYYHPGKR
jgi:hypothetical protein